MVIGAIAATLFTKAAPALISAFTSSDSKETAKSDSAGGAGDKISVTADQLVALKEGKVEIGDLLRNSKTPAKEESKGEDAGGGLLGGILNSFV